MNPKELYEEAVKRWGFKNQLIQLFQEMAELTFVLTKYNQTNEVDLDELAEEIADVVIMLDQMIYSFSIEDKVVEKAEEKIKRLEAKLKNEQ